MPDFNGFEVTRAIRRGELHNWQRVGLRGPLRLKILRFVRDQQLPLITSVNERQACFQFFKKWCWDVVGYIAVVASNLFY